MNRVKKTSFSIVIYSFFVTALLTLNVLTFTNHIALAAPETGQPLPIKSNLAPKELISQTIDNIVLIVSQHPNKSEKVKLREKLHTLIEPHFDFKEMSKRSLGSYWNSINEAQQSEFVSIFSNLLSRTYLSYLETVEPGMVKVLSEEIKPATTANSYSIAVVRTDVKHKGELFPIHYKLVQRSGGWKVYDVVIENIGLVSNYRSEFAGILRKNGFDGLIEKLKSKDNK